MNGPEYQFLELDIHRAIEWSEMLFLLLLSLLLLLLARHWSSAGDRWRKEWPDRLIGEHERLLDLLGRIDRHKDNYNSEGKHTLIAATKRRHSHCDRESSLGREGCKTSLRVTSAGYELIDWLRRV